MKLDSMNVGKIIENSLSNDAKWCMRTLESAGGKAYAVGGCVRDAILREMSEETNKENFTTHDEDITTNLTPLEVKRIFEEKGCLVVETGLQHGTITIFPKGSKEGFEITTFRSDGDYSDGRHPDSVVFVDNVLEDLKRRDLTINAMAFSLSEGFVSAKTIDKNGVSHSGLEDLQSEIIRAVGDASERISEDALRMMRAIRFAARFGYGIDEELLLAIKEHSIDIHKVSVERINDELDKLVATGNLDYFYTLHEVGLLKEIIPELDSCIGYDQLNNWHKYDLGTHIIEASKNGTTMEEKWALLLHDIGKIEARQLGINGMNLDELKALGDSNINKAISTFESSAKEKDLLNLKELLDNKGIDTSKLVYKTVERDGETFISSRFHGHADISSNMAINILKRLRKSNDEIKEILPLIKHHDIALDYSMNLPDKKIKEGMIQFFIDHQDLANEKFINSLFNVIKADESAQNEKMYELTNSTNLAHRIESATREILSGPHLIGDIDINGRDLMALGFSGKEIQEEKVRLLQNIMLGKVENSYEVLMENAFKRIPKVHKDYLASVNFEELNKHDNLGEKLIDNLYYMDNYYFSSNPTLSDSMIEKYRDKLDKTALTCMLNSTKRLTSSFIENNLDLIDFGEITNSKNPNFREIVENYADKLDWNSIFCSAGKNKETLIDMIKDIDREEVYKAIESSSSEYIPENIRQKIISISD